MNRLTKNRKLILLTVALLLYIGVFLAASTLGSGAEQAGLLAGPVVFALMAPFVAATLNGE